MSKRIGIRNGGGDEVWITLHPISLALIVSELIEDVARRRCGRKGHVPDEDDDCERCGVSLPDNWPWGSWLPDAYRTIRRKQ